MHINVATKEGTVSIEGSEDRVLFVLEKLLYMSLDELNEKDLKGVKVTTGGPNEGISSNK